MTKANDDRDAWLAHDFVDFVGRWSRVCGVEAEFDWEPFLSPTGAGLDPDCDKAREWRDLLGVRF